MQNNLVSRAKYNFFHSEYHYLVGLFIAATAGGTFAVAGAIIAAITAGVITIAVAV